MILLLESVHPDAEAILASTDRVVLAPSPTQLPDDACDEIRAVVTRGLGRVDATMIAALPELKVIARCGAGVDNIDVDAARRRGVTVVCARGATTQAVAELAMLLTLGLARKIAALTSATSSGNWAIRDGYEGRELAGRRMGVVGLGSIGRRVAQLGRAFGMETIGWNRSERTIEGVHTVGLDELFATSDVVQVCVASTPETHHIVNTGTLARLPGDALVVNTARGALVDHEAVASALDAGRLGGYGADVWDPEPPRPDDRLISHERVLVTPHVAALTSRTYRQLCLVPCESVVAVLNGRAPDPATLVSG